MSFTVVDHDNKRAKSWDEKHVAQEKRDDIASLDGVDPDDVELVSGEYDSYDEFEAARDGSNNSDAEVVDTTDVPDNPDVTQDPVDWMPSHFVDDIQGVPTVNRKGYAVIAAQYGVSVVAEPVVRASETDFEHAEFKAIATTEDGKEYSGFGSAHVDRKDGDDPYLLNELAETRAMKRAVAWATGVGMTAMSEMQNSL